MRLFPTVLLGLVFLLSVPLAHAQIELASDDAGAYTSGFFGSNEGSGFGTWTKQKESGGDQLAGDLGSDSDGGSQQSFAMFTRNSGGTTVSRALDTDLGGDTRYQITFKMKFDGIDPSSSDVTGTGVVLSDTEPGNQNGDVYAGEKLFVGLDGSGAWVYSNGSEFTALVDGDGNDFPANGGSNPDVYEVVIDVVPRDGDGDPTNGSSDIQVNNLDNNKSSSIATAGLANDTKVKTIGYAHQLATGDSGVDLVFDDITIVENPSSALPVELASFGARKNGAGALLSWKTISETDNSGFAVQRAMGTGSFEKIGWVRGAGTTTKAQEYRFSTDALSAGTHRFRLKQVDLDGSSSYSDVVGVQIEPEGPISVEGVAPNPLQTKGTLRFTMRESGPVTVALHDVLGRRVRTLHQGRVAAKQTKQVRIDASSLATGIYFLRVEGESFTQTSRVTVAR